MSKFLKSFLLVVGMLMLPAFSSCDWDDIDTSEDYDHPLYVSYTISVGQFEFTGPDQLLLDINAWIKANQIMYDRKVEYSTGEPEEFAKTDAEALKKYNEFVPKFKSYLDDVRRRLGEGLYATEEQPKVSVHAKFYTFASRVQGKENDLKSDTFELVYTDN